MRRSEAVLVAEALNDIEDFEMLMEQIEGVFNTIEGDFDNFYHEKMLPMLKKELERRESILENM